MENILALDLSTKRSGWATEVNGKLEYGAVAASSTDVEARIIKQRNEILEIIKKYNITRIIAEEVTPDGKNSHTGKVLNWLQAAIVLAVYEYDKKIKIEFIGASSWRSKIKIQGRAVKREQQKLMDIQYVKDHFGITVPDDEADAICILQADKIINPPPTVVDGFEFG